jgi:hypothetical protein
MLWAARGAAPDAAHASATTAVAKRRKGHNGKLGIEEFSLLVELFCKPGTENGKDRHSRSERGTS